MTVRLLRLAEGVRGACRRLDDGRVIIVIDRELHQAERTATLAHELKHIDRGSACGSDDEVPAEWWVIDAREERIIDEAVALDLVIADHLDDWLSVREDAELPVQALDVAIEWCVPERIAQIALVQAQRRRVVRQLADLKRREEALGCLTLETVHGPVMLHGEVLGLSAEQQAQLTAEVEAMLGRLKDAA